MAGMDESSRGLDSRRAWAMWVLGTTAYIAAVTQRTSFGVAAVAAGERFGTGATGVSLFVMVQLLTYALMQVPVGVLVDRFGTRRMLVAGAVLMVLGQLSLAFSTSLVPAIIARVLVGAGDASTFTPINRLLPSWFSPRKLPVLTQLVGITGQLGQLLSVGPFAAILHGPGWTPAFVSAAAFAALAGVLVGLLLRDAPAGSRPLAEEQPARLHRQLREVWAIPDTQLGFWIHWTCSFTVMTFALTWGYPFLQQGEGYPPAAASGLFALMAIAGVPFAPLIGLLSRRAPLQRSNLAFLITAGSAVPWTAVLLWPGQAPPWLLVVLVIGLSAGGPGSSIGFDVARAAVPTHRIGTAGGMVVMAGFLAAMLEIGLIGLVLDALGGYSRASFRWAWATQYLFLAIGIVGILRARAEGRRAGRARGMRYPTLWTVLQRESRLWWADCRALWSPEAGDRMLPRPTLSLPCAGGTEVRVVALLPGIGGRLVAVDVPPPDADADWWESRVDDYLTLVATGEAGVGSIEVRCADAKQAAAARSTLHDVLGARGSSLALEVRTLP